MHIIVFLIYQMTLFRREVLLGRFILFNITILIFTVSLGVTAAEKRHLRQLQEPKHYYTGTPQEFLLEYGMHYHLFDSFFPTGAHIVQTIPSNSTRQSQDISAKYRIRDYKNWQTWQVATASPLPSLASLSFVPKETNPDMIQYNSRYRFGPGPDDRFMAIGFTKDPWTEDNAHISFAGFNVNLPADREYICSFTQPVVASSIVMVTRGLRNDLNQPTNQNVVKCAVPPAVVDALRAQNKGQEDEGEVVVTLTSMRDNMPTPLLADIHVPRVYWLDRRRYKFLASNMVDTLEDPMVREWIVYNILLGAEHFVLYLNVKVPQVDISQTALRPFLDANLLTLVYYPFSHHDTFASVQHVYFNFAMHVYGEYVDWIAFWDVDEFFLPTPEFLTYLTSDAAPFPLESVTKTLAPEAEPGIMFDTIEMACEPQDENFYLSPHPNRKAVSVFCNRRGFYFRELTYGHGKMLIRPSRVTYLHSPHRMNDYWVVWTTPQRGGSMKHFSNFRHTKGMVEQGRMSWQDVKPDLTLKEFTLQALDCIMGVSVSLEAVRTVRVAKVADEVSTNYGIAVETEGQKKDENVFYSLQ